MSKFNRGILGGFSGKTGTVVGSTWKGKNIMRALPARKKNRRSSPEQLEQQEKFKLMVQFLSGLSDLLNITFGSQALNISGYNAAVSYNIREAIAGDQSPFSINFAKAKISQGNLPIAASPKAEARVSHLVHFSWRYNAEISNARPTDIAIMVVYCPELKQSIYVAEGTTRADEQYAVDAGVFAGHSVETWLAFVREDGQKASKSMYTGSISLTA
jgi:hypothetical protein